MLKKIVLTGAAGRCGSIVRPMLAAICEELISSDIVESIDALAANESYVKADLADYTAIAAMMDDVEMVVHFGAIVDEGPFEELLGPNFIGSYNVWDSAQKAGARRIVYASSIHAVGMHPRQSCIGIDAEHRPDTFYGLAKCFTEDLGRMYWEKRGIESVHLRILSCAPVKNARALGTWLSDDDLVRLVQRAIDTPTTGFAVIYGVSDNDRSPVDNSKAAFLGYRPQDNAEQFAEEILATEGAGDPGDLAQMVHGGPFGPVPLGQGGAAAAAKGDD
ncbi:NAD-dependent epimerase/dehydratase family protein [Jannaschia sp. CCS1]|uniref:NAD-dependent epimerase/dehydratase family protein n=1 Tax=Jannaschia sp. (strain CCS1) TaxID=290400 RepID=UPI000053CA61|nr:NAD(P)-dependent oxidoreductase [Jannaschia sp. CCS1]ABD56414.1 3-beta hydroxysteroid dehydrogenase/isomerase [Jannaschia sp. CCS1]